MEEELARLRAERDAMRTAASLILRVVTLKAELEEELRRAEDPDVRAALDEIYPNTDFDALAADSGRRVRALLHPEAPARAPPRREQCAAPSCRARPTPKCKERMCAKHCDAAHDQTVCRFCPTAGKRPRVPPAGDK